MAWSQLPTRSSSDTNSAADVNQLQTNLDAIKGGTLSSAPTQTLEQTITRVGTAESDIDALQLITGIAYSTPSSNVALTNADYRCQIMTPSADIDVTLPTTSVLQKDIWKVVNDGYKVITLKSSDGDVLGYIHKDGIAEFSAKQNTPTDKTHWTKAINNKIKTYTLSYNGGTGTLQDNGTYAIVTPSTTIVTGDMTAYATLFVSPMNQWTMLYQHGIEWSGGPTNPKVTLNGSVNFSPYCCGSDLYRMGVETNDAGCAGIGADVQSYGTSMSNSMVSVMGRLTAKPAWAD